MPPVTPAADLDAQLRCAGWAVLDGQGVLELAGVAPGALDEWLHWWHQLPPDEHLLDGGRYRYRQHSSFVAHGGQLQQVPHRAHWQPVAYNALHGGIERWFEPMPSAWTRDASWARLLLAFAAVAGRMKGLPATQDWSVEAHPFRITTEGGIGRPTPEGAHRDGVDLVVVMMVHREAIKGGETRVFDARGPQGVRFTLQQPWSALVLDDARVIHESTPIQALDSAVPAWRDTLVLTFRHNGFQDP